MAILIQNVVTLTTKMASIAVRDICPFPYFPYPPLLSPCPYVLPPYLFTISRDHTQRPTTFALTT
jgi:hypothetical protein